MSDVITTAPADGTFNYALINPRLNPNQPYFESIYDETVTARSIEWPHKLALPIGGDERREEMIFYPRKRGDRVSMMFVRNHHLRDRLTGLGWHDVTAVWGSRPGVEVAVEPPVPPVPAPSPLVTGGVVKSKKKSQPTV